MTGWPTCGPRSADPPRPGYPFEVTVPWDRPGGMAERTNARLLKSRGTPVPVGSNPTPSAVVEFATTALVVPHIRCPLGRAPDVAHSNPRCMVCPLGVPWPALAPSRDGAGGKDPFGGLAGHVGNDVEVVVIVENDQTRRFRSCGDEEIGDLGAPLLASFGEQVLYLHGTFEYGLI